MTTNKVHDIELLENDKFIRILLRNIIIIIDLIMLALAVSNSELLSAIFMSFFLTFPVVPIPFCYLKPSRSLFVESTYCFDVCHCVFYHRRIPQQDSHLHLTRSYVLA